MKDQIDLKQIKIGSLIGKRFLRLRKAKDKFWGNQLRIIEMGRNPLM